jgi:hypothetical protein
MLHHGNLRDNRNLSGFSDSCMSRNRKRDRSQGGGSRALKAVLITGAALLVLLFVGLFALKTGIERYRNSDAFRQWVGRKVAAALRSDVELASLRWEGGTAFADGFRVKGYEDADLAALEIDGLRATLDGAKDGAWQITDARVNRLKVDFSPDRLPGQFATHSGVPTGGGGGGPSAPAWLRRFLPDQFHVGQIGADAATLTVFDSAKTEVFALRSVKTDFQPAAGGGWEIAGQGGRLFVAGRPDMGIDRFRVRWQNDQVFLNQAEIDLPDKARVSASGVVALNEGNELDLDLDLAIANLDIRQVLNPEWQERVSGSLRGDIKVTGAAGSPDALKQSGTLHLDQGQVKNVPLLMAIARYTKSKNFERISLNETTARFERQGDQVRFTDLVVQSDGLARLEGSLSIDGGRLSGQFRLGVTPGTLRWIPGAERKVFVQSDKGFLWTDLIVSGTVTEPREDLSARLILGAAESLVEEAPEKALDAVKDALKDPAATPDTVIKEGMKALESLLPLLK